MSQFKVDPRWNLWRHISVLLGPAETLCQGDIIANQTNNTARPSWRSASVDGVSVYKKYFYLDFNFLILILI